ncbi:hypothetical protein [Burkholderia ubonensis]|uniref:hypothetical protein n=1 Tax=Burkholderia ubonensis TaxID=101571 RepID=UPI0018E03806|nr:hypothetical protein [Burkholderia ubonensis]
MPIVLFATSTKPKSVWRLANLLRVDGRLSLGVRTPFGDRVPERGLVPDAGAGAQLCEYPLGQNISLQDASGNLFLITEWHPSAL